MIGGALKLLEWIAKYWIEVLFGFIISGFGFFLKSYIKMFKKQMEQKDKELRANIRSEFEAREQSLKQRIREELEKERTYLRNTDDEIKTSIHNNVSEIQGEITIITQGMLSVQGKQFRQDCRSLLADSHFITVEEFEELEDDYNTYKALKGNHTGDALHLAVVEKFQAQMVKK